MTYRYKTLVFKLNKPFDEGNLNPLLEEEMDQKINLYAEDHFVIGDAYTQDNWLMVMMVKEEKEHKKKRRKV